MVLSQKTNMGIQARQATATRLDAIPFITLIPFDLAVIMYPLSKTSVREPDIERDVIGFLPFNAIKRYRFQDNLDELQP
jgi:hypothetical protein